MKELLAKYFGRILAILGCTTMVTACYGVPYSQYDPDFNVSGRVVDSETEKPIQDIKVRAVPSSENPDTYPYDSASSTNSEGFFNILGVVESPPSGFIIECTDVDGDLNGSYESVIEEIPYDESHDILIKMTPKRQ